MEIFTVSLTDQNGYWRAQGLNMFGRRSESEVWRISRVSYRSIAVMSSIWNLVPPASFPLLFGTSALGQHGRTSHRDSLKPNRALPPRSSPGHGPPPPRPTVGSGYPLLSPWSPSLGEKPWYRWHKCNRFVPHWWPCVNEGVCTSPFLLSTVPKKKGWMQK